MFLKTFAATAALLFTTAMGIGQTDVAAVLYLNKGGSLHYEMTEGQKNYKNEKLTDSTGRLSKIHLTVLDSTEKSYVFRYEIESRIPELKGFRLKKPAEKVKKELGNFQIQYKTSELGEFVELKNKTAIVNYTKKMLGYLEPEKADKESEKMLENLKATVFSDKFIEAVIMENLNLLHGPHGGTYALDTLNAFEFQEENVLNPAKPFNIKGTSLAYYDEDDHEVALLEIEQTYQTDEIKGTVIDIFQKAGADKKALDEMKKVKLGMEVSQLFAFDAATGVMLFVSHQKKIYADGKIARVDFKKFVLEE
jgi:hypothetical protein